MTPSGFKIAVIVRGWLLSRREAVRRGDIIVSSEEVAIGQHLSVKMKHIIVLKKGLDRLHGEGTWHGEMVCGQPSGGDTIFPSGWREEHLVLRARGRSAVAEIPRRHCW